MEKFELTEDGLALKKANRRIVFSGNPLDTTDTRPFTLRFDLLTDDIVQRAYSHPSGDGRKYFRLKPAAPAAPAATKPIVPPVQNSPEK